MRQMMIKEKCIDIFKHAKLDNDTRIQEKLSEKKYLELKLSKHKMNYQVNKLRMIMKFQLLKGEYFLQLMLKKIKVATQLFVIEIEQENEVLIPRELS